MDSFSLRPVTLVSMLVMPEVEALKALSTSLISCPMLVMAAWLWDMACPAAYQLVSARVSALLQLLISTSVWAMAVCALFNAV